MREMATCTCNGGADISKNQLLTECQICGGLKPVDKIVTMNINGDVRIFNSIEEYEEYQAKGIKELFDNAFTSDGYEKSLKKDGE